MMSCPRWSFAGAGVLATRRIVYAALMCAASGTGCRTAPSAATCEDQNPAGARGAPRGATLVATPTEEPSPCVRVTTPFTGSICAPGDGRRHPAIALFGGSNGGDSMRPTAIAFAARGYVAASVVYFGVEGTPPFLVDVPVEIADTAIDALARRPDVDPARIAVMGTSKGGEYALLVASNNPRVKAVVAIVPSPLAYFGLGAHGLPTGCPWTRNGRKLPCVPQDPAAGAEVWRQMQAAEQPIAFRPSNEASRAHASPATLAAAFFPLERIRGPLLCLAGDDDQSWNSRALCELAMDYLRVHQHPFADRMMSYPEAGHLFLLAERGPWAAINRVKAGSFEMSFGGTPDGDHRAAVDAWPRIHAFLTEALR